jgi:hypothetical protein
MIILIILNIICFILLFIFGICLHKHYKQMEILQLQLATLSNKTHKEFLIPTDCYTFDETINVPREHRVHMRKVIELLLKHLHLKFDWIEQPRVSHAVLKSTEKDF